MLVIRISSSINIFEDRSRLLYVQKNGEQPMNNMTDEYTTHGISLVKITKVSLGADPRRRFTCLVGTCRNTSLLVFFFGAKGWRTGSVLVCVYHTILYNINIIKLRFDMNSSYQFILSIHIVYNILEYITYAMINSVYKVNFIMTNSDNII